MPSYLWKCKQVVENAKRMLVSKRDAQDRRQRPEILHLDLARVRF